MRKRAARLAILSAIAFFGGILSEVEAQRRGRSSRKPRNQVNWAVNFDQAWVEAAERGCPVILFFIQDGEPENERMVQETMESREFAKLADKFVSLVASRGTSADHRELPGKRDGLTVQFCKKYKTLTCPEHQEIEKAALLAFFDGFIDTPHTIVCLPDRTVVGRFDDHVPLTDVVNLMQKALDQTGQGLSRSHYLEVRDGLTEATGLTKKKNYTDAWKALEKMLDLRPQGIQLDKINGLLETIQKEGNEYLKDAEVKIRLEKYGRAVEILETTIRLFKNTSIHKDARKRLNGLKKDPKVVAALKSYAREKKASDLAREAGKLVTKRSYVKAAAEFIKVLEFYSDTEAAELATEELGDLVGDARSASSIKRYMEGEAQKRLRRGESFLNNGQKARAAQAFEVIVRLFGETPAATAAKTKLEEING